MVERETGFFWGSFFSVLVQRRYKQAQFSLDYWTDISYTEKVSYIFTCMCDTIFLSADIKLKQIEESCDYTVTSCFTLSISYHDCGFPGLFVDSLVDKLWF